jgi:4-amino-4-deoxy-L-arabinose transferase-like glycosyltransferase
MRALEAILTSATSALVAILGMLLWNYQIGILAAVLWSTYPLHLWLTQQPDPATVFTLLLLIGAIIFAKSTRHHYSVRMGCILGLILGVAALLKPIAIALPVVFALLALFCSTPESSRRRALFAMCVVICYVLVVSPWEVWAKKESGKWIPLCTNGSNVLIDGLTLGTVRGLRPLFLPSGVQALADDAVSKAKTLNNLGSVMSFFAAKAEQAPGTLIQFFATKAILSWYGTESRRFYRSIILIQSMYAALTMIGAILICRGTREQRNFLRIATLITLYFWSITTLTALPDLRYLIPATSLLMIHVAVAVNTIAICFINSFKQNR